MSMRGAFPSTWMTSAPSVQPTSFAESAFAAITEEAAIVNAERPTTAAAAV